MQLRVLLVEDSKDDAELIVRLLKRSGYDLFYEQVDTAPDLQAALQKEWDLIISDYSMPTFNAPSALDLIQSHGIDIPFIMVSGSIGEDAAVNIMRAGAHDYILKDNLIRLVPAIERELREAKIRQERHQITLALLDNEERLRGVVDLAADGIITIDEHGVIESFNKAAEKIFGYTTNEVMGQNVKMLMNTHDYHYHDQYLSNYLTTGEKKIIGIGREVIGRRKDGSTFPMDLAVSEVQLHERRIFTGIVRDITERKQAEQDLLEAALMQERLKKEREVVELKERFNAMVSHEFRTPLTVITLSSEMLLTYQEKLPLNSQIKQLNRIKMQTEYMTSLLDDVLLLSQARAGKLDYAPKYINLEPFCWNLFEPLQLTDQNRHQFVFQVEGPVQNVWVDEKLLQHILINLLTNAIKYSPQGGEVRLKIERIGDDVLIRVSDQGLGITEEDRIRLFEPFHRGSNTSSIPGTGLGLSIVKNSVEAHHGTIECLSSIGEGTTFLVRLPAKAP